MSTHKNLHTNFKAALFTIAKKENKSKSPLTYEWTKCGIQVYPTSEKFKLYYFTLTKELH